VPALRILCIVGLLRSLQNPVGALLVAKGRARTGFLCNIAMLAMNLALFPFATARGLEWLATAAGVTMLLNIVFFWRSLYWDTIQLPPGELLKPLLFPALLSIVMAVAVWFLILWFPTGWPVVVKLLARSPGEPPSMPVVTGSWTAPRSASSSGR